MPIYPTNDKALLIRGPLTNTCTTSLSDSLDSRVCPQVHINTQSLSGIKKL